MEKRLFTIGVALTATALLMPIGAGWLQARSSTALAQVFDIIWETDQAVTQAKVHGTLQEPLPGAVAAPLRQAYILLSRSERDPLQAATLQPLIVKQLRLAKDAAATTVVDSNSGAALAWNLALVLGCSGLFLVALSRLRAHRGLQGTTLGRAVQAGISATDALAGIADGALVVQGGRVAWVNPAFCRLTSIEEQLVVGQELEVVRRILGAERLIGNGDESITLSCSPQAGSELIVCQSPISVDGSVQPDQHLLLLRPKDREIDRAAIDYRKELAAIYQELADAVSAAELEIDDLAPLKAALSSARDLQAQANLVLDVLETFDRLAYDRSVDEQVRALATSIVEDEHYAEVRERSERMARAKIRVPEAHDQLEVLEESITALAERLRNLSILAVAKGS